MPTDFDPEFVKINDSPATGRQAFSFSICQVTIFRVIVRSFASRAEKAHHFVVFNEHSEYAQTVAQPKTLSFSTTVRLSVRCDEYRDSSGINQTLVLLHGYGESKERFWKTLGSQLTGLYQRLLILNAPFPAPYLSKDGYKEGYAWYFQTAKQALTLISPLACADFFQNFVANADLGANIKVIGYSQGGYAMPYLCEKIPNLSQMIGISCGTHDRPCVLPASTRVDYLHGRTDKVIAHNEAKAQVLKVHAERANSFFHELAGGHEIDLETIHFLQNLLGGRSS